MSDGILIVCGQRNLSEFLISIFSSAVPGRHSSALTGAEARRKTSLEGFAAVLIAGRVSDDRGVDLAQELVQTDCGSVILVTERGDLYDAHEALDGTGVTILSKPLSKDALLQAVTLVLKTREAPGTLEKAKLMLIQYKHWTEPQAHRYIQKLSMDKRLPREVAAQMVIKSLEHEYHENV